MKTLKKITKKQIAEKGVQALSNKPNIASQYGVGGLSAENLKLWFDKLATFLADKINEVCDALGADDAAEYIRLALDDYGIETLDELIAAILNGDLADRLLQVLPSADALDSVTLQQYINQAAYDTAKNTENIGTLFTDKLDKVKAPGNYRRAYIIDTDGSQKTVYISEAPLVGAIPVFVGDGQINVAVPTESTHAVNKGYVDDVGLLLGSRIELSLDKSTYVMTARLKNLAGELLNSAQIDFPLESVVVGGEYLDGILTLTFVSGESVDIDVSDMIDGLINSTVYETDIGEIRADIKKATDAHRNLVQEIDLSKIYGYAAHHAEEAETARNYTKGGKIDRSFRRIDKMGGFSIALEMAGDYKLKVLLKNLAGEAVSTADVELPIDGLMNDASYKDGILTITFKNGDPIKIDISDMVKGFVPETRKVNGKVLSSDIHLSAEDIGAAPSSHGIHLPALQTLNVATFLRNDGTWQKVTPTNIGAAPSSHGNHVPETETADNARFLRNDNTWQTITPANIGAAAATEIAKTVSTGLSNSGVAYVKISGFGNWGTGNWYDKGFAMLITSRGGELIWVAVSSDDSNTNAKAIRLLNTYSKINAIHYSTSESAVYVTVNAWCNNVNAHILSNVNGDYIPTVAQANALPSDAVKITIAEFGVTGSATNIGDSSRAIAMIGSGTRPTYNNAEMAMKSDIPAIPTETWTFTLEDGSTVTKVVRVG